MNIDNTCSEKKTPDLKWTLLIVKQEDHHHHHHQWQLLLIPPISQYGISSCAKKNSTIKRAAPKITAFYHRQKPLGTPRRGLDLRQNESVLGWEFPPQKCNNSGGDWCWVGRQGACFFGVWCPGYLRYPNCKQKNALQWSTNIWFGEHDGKMLYPNFQIGFENWESNCWFHVVFRGRKRLLVSRC